MIKKGRSKEIDAARGVGIILVVLGHCIRGMAGGHLGENVIFKTLDDFLYSFHMPLIFFISGVVSLKILNFDREHRHNYIKSRFIRLMIPYIIVTLLYTPFILLLSKFANSPYDIKKFPLVLLGQSPYGVLWFSYSLFLIQAFAGKFANENNLPLMIFVSPVILSVMNAFTNKTGINLYSISNAFINCPFFMLGIWFGKQNCPPPITYIYRYL